MLQSWIGVRTLPSIAAAFDAQKVLWGPYQTFKELVAEDPRASSSNPLFADVEHPDLGTYPTPGSPLRFGAVEALPPKPGPKLGEHTEEVLREFNLS